MANLKKAINFFRMAEILQDTLMSREVPFYDTGFPDLRGFEFLKRVQESVKVLPLSRASTARDPSRTILCAYELDSLLYRHANLIPKRLPVWRNFQALCGFDFSPCQSDPLEEQFAMLLLNTLINGYLLTEGVKVIPSLRTGSIETILALQSYPSGICYSVGALGCQNGTPRIPSRRLLQTKLKLKSPSQLLIYGRLNRDDIEMIGGEAIPIVCKRDFRAESYARAAEREA